MKKILFDTNFLIDLIRFKIGLEEIDKLVEGPYRIVTVDKVANELRSIASKNAKAALKLVKIKKIGIVRTKERNADAALIVLADKDTMVATNDAELRKRLRGLGVKTIYLRKRKHLAIS